jgi:hypothetical protein
VGIVRFSSRNINLDRRVYRGIKIVYKKYDKIKKLIINIL